MHVPWRAAIPSDHTPALHGRFPKADVAPADLLLSCRPPLPPKAPLAARSCLGERQGRGRRREVARR
eukprot:6326711-Pyramimonas_sp.AAC.1